MRDLVLRGAPWDEIEKRKGEKAEYAHK